MLDTNTITQAANNIAAAQVAAAQAAQAAAQIKETISPWLPALTIAAGWAGRELNRACASAKTGAEWLMSHGGILKLLGKLFWN